MNEVTKNRPMTMLPYIEPDVDLSSPEWADVNIITGCLKLYLRELPDPVIPFRQFRSLIDAASKDLLWVWSHLWLP